MMEQNQPLELSEEEKKELSIGLLREWWLTSIQALVDTADSETALSYFKPHWVHAWKAAARVFSSLTGITDPVRINLLQGHILAIMMDGTWGPGYAADDGSTIGELFDCTSGGSYKEVCLLSCDYASYILEELDSPYEMTLINSLSKGDKSCQWLVARRGKSPKVQPTEEFRTPPHLRITGFLPSEEMINSIAHAYIGEMWVMATKAFIEQAGSEKALERLGFYMRHSGMSLGIRLADRLNAHQRKADSVVDLLLLIQDLHQRDGEERREINYTEYEIMKCPFSGSPPEICYQYQAFFNGVCEAIDPDHEFAYDRMMTKGDKTCHWTIRKKGGAMREKSREEPSLDDPIKRLTNKFIDGEITEEEFRKKMGVLKEFKL
jgi:predicted hydrocarbon binding protein